MTKEEFNIQDERLLGQFFEKERSKVLVVLRNRLSISTEDAEDIYQDACIALFNNIQKGKLKTLTCSLSTYFTQICLNMGYNFVNRGHSTTSSDQLVDNTQYDEYDLAKLEAVLGLGQGDRLSSKQVAMMRDIVQDLPQPCEQILWLYYGDDLSMKEIADIIGFNGADSVKSKKSQCMSKLKERFNRIIKLFYE